VSQGANNALDANIYGVMGSTGSGKSLYVKLHLLKKSCSRLAIWDYKREYGYDLADTVTESITEAVRAMQAGRFRVVFRPSFSDKVRARQFDLFCKAVWHAKNTFCIVEELAMVTTPQRAPEGWKQLTCTGRSEGITIVGLSQRPAQVDKDFFDNCTELHCGFLAGKRSRQVMAEELGIEEADIMGLGPLEYVHKNLRTKEIYTGKVRPPLRKVA
jgi:hypothetical protein